MNLKTKLSKMSVLSALLVLVAAVLGADSSFAMAVVDAVDLADDPNPSDNVDLVNNSTNPTGRPAGEEVVDDEQGRRTQMPNHSQTATDFRDAGLLAEDYDEKTVEFRKFRFPEETIIARVCKPVKAKDYKHRHWVSGSTDLDAVFLGVTSGSDIVGIAITAGSASGAYIHSTKTLTISASAFDNDRILTEYSTIAVENVKGFKKDEDGNEVADGELVLFVESYKKSNDNIVFKVVNPPVNVASTPTSVTIPPAAKFHVMSTACSESQMHVASHAYMPTEEYCYLQKKIETVTVTDFFENSEKKMDFKTKNALTSAKENFKRKCARSHWNGTESRIQEFIPELNGREDIFMEKGIIRQIPMLYTHGADLDSDDFMAMTTLMFTTNASNDHAYAFCGKKAMARVAKYVNTVAQQQRGVSDIEVNRFGIKIRKYEDNFGTLEFIWAQSLDDLGYEQYMFILDLENAERPYLVNDKQTTRDMSKTAEAREAKEYNLVRIDCIDLKGHNAVAVCPSSIIANGTPLGSIEATFTALATAPTSNTDKTVRYYCTSANTGFEVGTVIEYDADLQQWVEFQGLIA